MAEDSFNGSDNNMELVFNKLLAIEEKQTSTITTFSNFAQEVLNLQKNHEKTHSQHNLILRGIRRELNCIRKDNHRAISRKGVSETLLITVVTIIALITGGILFHNSTNELHGKFGQAQVDITHPDK